MLKVRSTKDYSVAFRTHAHPRFFRRLICRVFSLPPFIFLTPFPQFLYLFGLYYASEAKSNFLLLRDKCLDFVPFTYYTGDKI